MEPAICSTSWCLCSTDGIGLPSIGGKDSMSGTFNDIDVPPTLVSFAVDVAKLQDVITPELKKAGNKLVWLRAPKDQYDLPDYTGIMEQYEKLHNDMQAGKVVSAYALDRHGIAAAVSKMAFGNAMGVKIEHSWIQETSLHQASAIWFWKFRLKRLVSFPSLTP